MLALKNTINSLLNQIPWIPESSPNIPSFQVPTLLLKYIQLHKLTVLSLLQNYFDLKRDLNKPDEQSEVKSRKTLQHSLSKSTNKQTLSLPFEALLFKFPYLQAQVTIHTYFKSSSRKKYMKSPFMFSTWIIKQLNFTQNTNFMSIQLSQNLLHWVSSVHNETVSF